AALLVAPARACARAGGRRVLRGLPEAFRQILVVVRPELRGPRAAGPCPPCESVAPFVGRRTVVLLRDARSLVGFVGEVTVAMLHAILFPHRVRWRDVLRAMQTTGVDAFPVVMLVSALLGLILSYQSADIL